MAFASICALVLAALYVATPYTAFGPRGDPRLAWLNVRYLFPAFVLAYVVACRAVPMSSPKTRRLVQFAALVAAVQGIHEAYDVTAPGRSVIAIGALAVVVIAAGGIAGSRVVSRSRLAAWGCRTGIALVATALIIFVAGYVVQHNLNAKRYAPYDPTYAWIQDHPQPRKIGLAGSWNFAGASPAWAMYGPSLENRVTFVGQHHGDHLVQYQTESAWLQALRQGRFDLVEIALNKPEPDTSDAEIGWARQAKLPVVSESQRFLLVRATGLWES
jgi:hypothetical protein